MIMLVKIVHVGVSNSAATIPDNVHKGVMYIPQSNLTRSEITNLWSLIPYSASLEETIQSMLTMNIVGGGYPFIYPYIYSGDVDYKNFTDYSTILQAVPYSAKVIDEYYSTNVVVHYVDENKNGDLNCNFGVGMRWRYETSNPTIGNISQLGFPFQTGVQSSTGSGFFITSDDYVGCFYLNINRNNSNIGWFTYSVSQNIINWVNSLPDLILDPYADGGVSDVGGGTGDFDDTSEPIDFPALPVISATDTGFITLFNPSLSELQSLAAYMWNGSLFDISTFQKLFADPMNAILGLSVVPVAIPNGGQSAIKVGNIATPVNMNKAASQYVEVDCGTLNINEYWGAYLDYAPYTKAEIYLPYCGTHAIDIDDIMDKSVHVKYHVDILSGACVAYVKCDDSVLYQFSGQCSSSIPISGTDFTQMINGVLSAAVSIGTMVATGGASAPLAIPALANTAINGGMKPSIEKSGAISGTSGMLAIQKPYMILTRPKQALPANQNTYTGYPSYVTVSLGDITGYTEIEHIHLEGVSGTDSEIDEIITLLKAGVIL